MAKRRGAQFWREHVEAWDRSDLTQSDFTAPLATALCAMG